MERYFSDLAAYCMKRDQVLADWLDRTLLRYQGEGGGEEQVDQARVETQSESRSRQETSDV
jgi:hypothetical protein